MTAEQILRKSLVCVEANEDFTESVMRLRDGTRLCFCHRVGERWAKAVGPEGDDQQGGLAENLVTAIAIFRLNAKHLDIQFADGSRWDEPIG